MRTNLIRVMDWREGLNSKKTRYVLLTLFSGSWEDIVWALNGT